MRRCEFNCCLGTVACKQAVKHNGWSVLSTYLIYHLIHIYIYLSLSTYPPTYPATYLCIVVHVISLERPVFRLCTGSV